MIREAKSQVLRGSLFEILARKSRKCSGLQFFFSTDRNCREAEKPARKLIRFLVPSFLILLGDWIT